MSRPYRMSFGRPMPIKFDVFVVARRLHTPTIRTEYTEPDDVKAYIINILNNWMHNMKLTARQESGIGKARHKLSKLEEDDFWETIGRVWSMNDPELPAEIIVCRWPDVY